MFEHEFSYKGVSVAIKVTPSGWEYSFSVDGVTHFAQYATLAAADFQARKKISELDETSSQTR